MNKTKLVVVTNIPTPNMDAFFSEIARDESFDICVLFCSRRESNRLWRLDYRRKYSHRFLRGLTLGIDGHVNFGIRRELARERPDLLMVVGAYATLAGQLTMRWAMNRKVPWIYWSEQLNHDSVGCVKTKVRHVLRRPLFMAGAIMGIGDGGVKSFRAMGVHADKIVKAAYYHQVTSYRTVREFVGQTTFAIIGQMITRKNVGWGISVFRDAGLQGNRLVIIGAGPLETRLRVLAGGDSQITFTPFLEPDKLIGTLSGLDVLLFPSAYDGWGMVVQETMSAGMVVITSPNVGAHELIRDGQSGFVIELEKRDQWVDTIRVLSDKRALKTLAREAEKDVASLDVAEGVSLVRGLRSKLMSLSGGVPE